jgi:hypothetical protein
MSDIHLIQPNTNINYHNAIVEGYVIGILILAIVLILMQTFIAISIYQTYEQLEILKEIYYEFKNYDHINSKED